MNQPNQNSEKPQLESPAPSRGLWASIILFLSLIGPGIITGNFGNDAGGITTYSVAGAKYGLGMLWMVIPVVLLLVLYQEIGGRMGAVTGKGLSDLIRENFGIRFSFYLMIGKFFAGMANALAEFAGIAAAMELFGISKYISVPVLAVIIWLLAIKANYRKIEKLFLIGVLFFGAYIIAGILAPLDWHQIGKALINPSNIRFSHDYFILFVALIGTTIAPWMAFYYQSAVVEKGIRISDYRYFRWETIASGVSVAVVIFFIIVTCSTLHHKGIDIIETADQAALALEPLAGQYASVLFAIGLLVASIGAAMILPLSTSFSVCEIFGWESGVSKRFSEAPQFYGLFTFQLFIGAVIILIPGISLIQVMVVSQVINGLVLPFVLIPMLILVNRKKIMGKYTNGLIFNIIAIVATIAVTLAVVFLLVTTV